MGKTHFMQRNGCTWICERDLRENLELKRKWPILGLSKLKLALMVTNHWFRKRRLTVTVGNLPEVANQQVALLTFATGEIQLLLFSRKVALQKGCRKNVLFVLKMLCPLAGIFSKLFEPFRTELF